GEVECGRAGPANPAGRADHRGKLRQVDVQEVERLEGETSPEQRAARLRDGGDAQPRVFLERAAAANRAIGSLAADVVNHAGRQLALDETPDADRILRIAVQEIRR